MSMSMSDIADIELDVDAHLCQQGSHQEAALSEGFPPKPKSSDGLETLPSHLMKVMSCLPFLVLSDTMVTGNFTLGSKRILIFPS
jgi:hypothetical protein